MVRSGLVSLFTSSHSWGRPRATLNGEMSDTAHHSITLNEYIREFLFGKLGHLIILLNVLNK